MVNLRVHFTEHLRFCAALLGNISQLHSRRSNTRATAAAAKTRVNPSIRSIRGPPLRAYVHFRIVGTEFSGSASVRSVNRVAAGYEVGLELPPQPSPCGPQKFAPPQDVDDVDKDKRYRRYNQRLLLLLRLLFSPRVGLLAEILFLRRRLALYRERKSKARRPDPWTKLALVWLSGLFEWRDALAIVKPATFIRWHRAGFRLLWRWKSRRRGRPALPKDIRSLIRLMASENPSWGEEWIADELSLKLGVLVSPHGSQISSLHTWSTRRLLAALVHVRPQSRKSDCRL